MIEYRANDKALQCHQKNIEDTITSMLEKVLKDDDVEEFQDFSANFSQTCTLGEEFPSFTEGKMVQRSEKKARTTQESKIVIPTERKGKRSWAVYKPPEMETATDEIIYGNTHAQTHFDCSQYFSISDAQEELIQSSLITIQGSPYQSHGDEFLEAYLISLDRLEEDHYQTLKGKFFSIIMNQNGSRYLQKIIKKTSEDIISLMLDELLEQIPSLITSSYGNYFVQKFFGVLKNSDRIKFLTRLNNDILEVSKHKIGTYAVQAILEQLSSLEERRLVIDAIRKDVLSLCYDVHGVHIIEKIILAFEEDLIQFLYEILLENFLSLACNCNGLCVIKKMILQSLSTTVREKIIQHICDNIFFLVQNAFGNYVIQVAVEGCPEYYIYPIIRMLQNRLATLSMHKYSSNVVEKCLEKGGERVVNSFIDEMIINQKVADLMKNNFGNYVVQKTLKLATGEYKSKLITHILKDIEKIGDRKLILKWKSIVRSHLNATNDSEDFTFNQSCNLSDQPIYPPLFHSSGNISNSQRSSFSLCNPYLPINVCSGTPQMLSMSMPPYLFIPNRRGSHNIPLPNIVGNSKYICKKNDVMCSFNVNNNMPLFQINNCLTNQKAQLVPDPNMPSTSYMKRDNHDK